MSFLFKHFKFVALDPVIKFNVYRAPDIQKQRNIYDRRARTVFKTMKLGASHSAQNNLKENIDVFGN